MGGGMAVVVRVRNIYDLINQFLLGEIGKPPSFRTTTFTLAAAVGQGPRPMAYDLYVDIYILYI